MNNKPTSHFSLAALANHLEYLASKVSIRPPMQFVANCEKMTIASHCLKHDIHSNLHSALAIAQIESRLGVQAVFFAMPYHPITKSYYNSSTYDHVLKEIQNLGHCIGIHIDLFELAASGCNLNSTIIPFLDRLSRSNIQVLFGNSHGNTASAAEHGFNATQILHEVASFSNSQQSPNISNLYGCISLQSMSADIGIDYWLDTDIFIRGRLLTLNQMSFSDNYKTFAVYKRKAAQLPWIEVYAGGSWELTSAISEKVVKLTHARNCIHLFHPQFYKTP